MLPISSTNLHSDVPVKVGDDGMPVYCIHLADDFQGSLKCLMIPEFTDEEMQFIQSVCCATSCEVLVNLRTGSQEEGTDFMYPLGYYRHHGDRRLVGGRWLYMIRYWREFEPLSPHPSQDSH